MRIVNLAPKDAWTFKHLPAVMEKYGIRHWCVLHVGAHHGEEVGVYQELNFGKIILVEPDPQNVMILDKKFGGVENIKIRPLAAGTKSGPTTLYRSERSVWSSIVNDRKSYLSANRPEEAGEVYVYPLHEIQHANPYDNPNVIVIDTQGTELEVLKTADLKRVQLVIIEVCHREGDTASYYNDVVAYAETIGFVPVEEWVHDGSGYNDLILVQKDLV